MKRSERLLLFAFVFVALFFSSSLPAAGGGEKSKEKAKSCAKTKGTKKITSEQADKAIKDFRKEFTRKRELPAITEHKRISALKELAKVKHPLVLEELIKTLKVKNSYVQVEVLRSLGKMDFDSEKVGKILHQELIKTKDKKTILAALDSLGKVHYQGAYRDLVKLLRHEDDDILIQTVKTFGECKDIRAMKKFLSIFEFQSAENPSSGVRNRQQAGMVGPIYRMKRVKLDKLLKAMKVAMKQIAGEEIKTPQELRAWIKNNKEKIKNEERKKG